MSYFGTLYKQSRFFMCVAFIAILWGMLAPIVTMHFMAEKKQIIIMDDANNYHMVLSVPMPDAKKLHEECVKRAVYTLFNRNKNGLIDDFGMRQIYMKPTMEFIEKHLKDTQEEFNIKNIHQLVEIEKLKAIPQEDGSYIAHVKAILTRSCEYEKTAFVEIRELHLSLLLFENPDISQNGKMPLCVMKILTLEVIIPKK